MKLLIAVAAPAPAIAAVSILLLLISRPAGAGDTTVPQPSAPAAPVQRALDRDFMLGQEALAQPVRLREFSPPPSAVNAGAAFSGSLRLTNPGEAGRFEAIRDERNRLGSVGEPVRHLPEFDFRFVQRGADLVPLRRGVLRRQHPYWEIVLQPGMAWSEPGDGKWSRAALPFALQERGANCTHNGMLTWLYDGEGNVSRAAYQIGSETCPYFKFDMWGMVGTEFLPEDLSAESAGPVARLDAHRRHRLPVHSLAQLARDYPGVEPRSLGMADGINPDDMTVYGMAVDGKHYRSNCNTRHGAYRFCNVLPLPSYSTAKSIFAGIALLRLEKLYPGISGTSISSLVPACEAQKWSGVTIENALDMATGMYARRGSSADEDAGPQVRFVFSDQHADKIDFACNYYKRRTGPGKRWVYHTSDTYLAGVAMRQALAERQDAAADFYTSTLVAPIWRPLGLSPLLDDSKRTYDDFAQPFTGYGLTYEADDIVRLALWLSEGKGRMEDEVLLDPGMLDAAMQRDPQDRGLRAGSPNLRYNNGFWAFDAADTLGCKHSVWVPFMSGFGGITVAMFPNGIVYYYFSDGGVFRWGSAIIASNRIRSLC